MACIEVFDVPSAASNDDIGVLVSQFAPVVRILLLSAGPGGEGKGLVWLPPGSDLATVAEALDCHPVAGGLISTKLCDDPMRWVVNNIGTEQLIPVHGQPRSQPAPAPPAPAPLPMVPPAAPPAGPGVSPRCTPNARVSAGGRAAAGPAAVPAAERPTSADSSNGVSAMEAELREMQAQLQEQAESSGGLIYEREEHRQDTGGPEGTDTGGWGWGGSQGSSEDSGWQQAERRSGGGRRATAGGSASGSGSLAACSNIVVRNILPQLTHNQMFEFFKDFGWIEELAKPGREAQYVFVHFADPSSASAAKRALHGRVVPALNPSTEVTVEYRDPRVVPATRQPGVKGRETGSDVPTTKVWVGHVIETATVQTLTRIFGKFGDVYALELRRAPEAGRRDQWGFVNFRRLDEAVAAYSALRFRVIPELSGDKPLKLQYRPV